MPSSPEEILHLLTSELIVIVRFEKEFVDELNNSFNRESRFTKTWPTGQSRSVKPPVLCLAEFEDDSNECHLGVITSKNVVSTFDSRFTFQKFKSVFSGSLEELAECIEERRFANDLARRSRELEVANVLGSRLSGELIKILIELDLEHITKLGQEIMPTERSSDTDWAVKDAEKLAIKAFGLNLLKAEETPQEQERARVLEDNLIFQDATAIPGYDLFRSHVSGTRTFYNGSSKLDVITANRGPLEEMLGVDLIYINSVQGNAVLVQYKMLERTSGENGTDWIFRPDAQFTSERARMVIPEIEGEKTDYRMYSNPFYFKFAKRYHQENSSSGFIVSNEHIDKLLASASTLGPRGGRRINYDSLEGIYLRETDLVLLIRSGYIGTHRIETEALSAIIQGVLTGNHALVLAWQQKAQEPR